MKSVSFDFDDTLEYEYVYTYAKELIAKGIDIHIVTSRYSDPRNYLPMVANHNDLYATAKFVGIKEENIHFTEFRNKIEWFKEHPEYNFIWHLDDNWEELSLIKLYKNCNECSIEPIDVLNSNWKEKCEELLK